jgi:hypothetical protein
MMRHSRSSRRPGEANTAITHRHESFAGIHVQIVISAHNDGAPVVLATATSSTAHLDVLATADVPGVQGCCSSAARWRLLILVQLSQLVVSIGSCSAAPTCPADRFQLQQRPCTPTLCMRGHQGVQAPSVSKKCIQAWPNENPCKVFNR